MPKPPRRQKLSARPTIVVAAKPVVSRLATIEALLLEIQFDLAAQAKRLRAFGVQLATVVDGATIEAAVVRRMGKRT